MKTTRKAAICVVAAALACGHLATAHAQNRGEAVYRAIAAKEPSAQSTAQAALRYYNVNPDTLTTLRRSARARALLPILTAGVRFDDTRLADTETVTITNPSTTDGSANTKLQSGSVGLAFDLRELAFNPSQIQVYGLVGIQQDVMLEVVRSYYLRRQLQLRLLLQPPEDPIALATMQLRVEEYTALLDAMTGGWFTRQMNANTRGEASE